MFVGFGEGLVQIVPDMMVADEVPKTVIGSEDPDLAEYEYVVLPH